jgi:hypothetical protein
VFNNYEKREMRRSLPIVRDDGLCLDGSTGIGKSGDMKRFRAVPFLIFLIAVVPASSLTIETAYTRYYDEGGIRPIGQYFGASLTGQGFRTVIPSQPEEPAGQYFIIRLEDAKSAPVATARMTLYTTESKVASTRQWELAGTELDNWLYLGLTGTDWPDEDVRPLAWHIEILDAGGAVLTEWKSFLWELP